MAFLWGALRIGAALLVFGIIILVHEYGHFLAAKRMKVRVNEFAMGMGPKLFSWGKGETTYSIRLLPIGGFCAMEGEDDEAPTPAALGGNADRDENKAASTSGSFAEKAVYKRILIVVAGALMNLLLGFLVLLITFGCLETKAPDGNVYFNSVTVAQLPETAQSYQTGLRVGDTILKVDGVGIITDMDLMMVMQSDEDGVFDITVRRDGEKQLLKGVTFPLVTDETDGTRYLQYEFSVQGIQRTVWTTVKQAAKMEVSLGMSVWRSLGDIISGRYGLNDLSGPVGTVDFIGDAVSQAVSLEGWNALMRMIALITINVGIFNLLPLPALDGGRLLFLLIEAVTRRRVPAKYEGIVHFVGLILLLLLMVVITFSDVQRLIG